MAICTTKKKLLFPRKSFLDVSKQKTGTSRIILVSRKVHLQPPLQGKLASSFLFLVSPEAIMHQFCSYFPII